MTISEAARRVGEIMAIQADTEAAHSKEVDLLWDFVAEVSGADLDLDIETERLARIADEIEVLKRHPDRDSRADKPLGSMHVPLGLG